MWSQNAAKARSWGLIQSASARIEKEIVITMKVEVIGLGRDVLEDK